MIDKKLPRAWTPKETLELRRRFEASEPQTDIARAMDRSNQSIMSKIKEMRKHWNGPAPRPYIGRPLNDLTPFADNEHKHLRLVLAADPNGFCWLRPGVAARFYALEHVPADKSWWRAA